MEKKFFGLTVASVFLLASIGFLSVPALGGVSTAWAATEEFSYHDDVILDYFAHGEDEEHFGHLNGMIVQLWKEQQRFFESKGSGENTVAVKVEELFNESNTAASEGNYHEAYATLKNAFGLLKGSLDEMGIKKVR